MERKDDRDEDPDRSAEIIRRHLSGDRKAFGELVVIHGAAVRTECRITIRGRADVDDAVQETWTAVLKALPLFRGECAFSTWLHAVARACSLMALRNQWRNTGEPCESHEDPAPLPDERFDNARRLARVRAAWKSLPVQQRGEFLLHVLEGEPHSAVATKVSVSRSRKKLRGVI